MVKKQKTIPQLEAEKAENERKISQLQHKKQVPSRFMRKIVCRLRLNEVSRQ